MYLQCIYNIYSCEPGYQLSGRTHRYCQADGAWSPHLLPECKRE